MCYDFCPDLFKREVDLDLKKRGWRGGGGAEALSFCNQDIPCVFLNIKHYQFKAEDPSSKETSYAKQHFHFYGRWFQLRHHSSVGGFTNNQNNSRTKILGQNSPKWSEFSFPWINKLSSDIFEKRKANATRKCNVLFKKITL